MATHEETSSSELEGKPPPHEAKLHLDYTITFGATPNVTPQTSSTIRRGVKIPALFDLAPYRRDVRASDEDRDRAASSLREHFAAGRLEPAELERRIDRAYAAHSRRELAELLSDLPTDRLGHAAMRFYRGQRTALKYHALTYVTVNGSLVGTWELTGHGRGFWPAFVILPTSVVLTSHATASRWLRRKLGIGRGRTGAIS
jgi:hypothetical protein